MWAIKHATTAFLLRRCTSGAELLALQHGAIGHRRQSSTSTRTSTSGSTHTRTRTRSAANITTDSTTDSTTSRTSRRARRAKLAKSVLTLAIETSCDDTCVALLEKKGLAARLLYNAKITSDNIEFKGVHPTAAVTSHTAVLAGLVADALQALPPPQPGADTVQIRANGSKTPSERRKPTIVSVTRGPGMLSSLAVGLLLAKGLAVSWQVPLLAVHHMQAHALTPRLADALAREWPSDAPQSAQQQQQQQQQQEEEEEETQPPLQQPNFPFLSLLVSGGHTQLLFSRSLTQHTMLAEARNVAVGDMLDKCARCILPKEVLKKAKNVMYGAELEAFAFSRPASSSSSTTTDEVDYDYTPPARRADEVEPYVSAAHGWTLTPPLYESRDMAYDFSGLGGRVQSIMQERPDMDEAQRRELARATMKLVFEHLASRVLLALEDMRLREVKRAHARLVTASAAAPRHRRDGDEGDGRKTPAVSPEEKAAEERAHMFPFVETLVVSGGVASNGFLQHVLREMLRVRGFGDLAIVRPPLALCTDNAAMIAWTGVEMYLKGWRSELDVLPIRSWPMDPGSEGGGIMGTPGWASRKTASPPRKKQQRRSRRRPRSAGRRPRMGRVVRATV